jgi:hypothetical protein
VGGKRGARFSNVSYLEQQGQRELISEDPTPVIEGVLTEKQKAHSQIFSKQYELYRHGERLRDLPGTSDTGLIISVPHGWVNMLPYHSLIKRFVCDADAVIVGVVTSKSSQLTTDGTFVFTDYQMSVEDVLKNNAAAVIQTNSNVTVTRAGGAILLNMRRIQVTDKSFEALKVNGHYVLFLNYIPSTGAYMALNSKGSFQIRDKKVIKLTGEPLIPELEGGTGVGSFIDEIRARSSSPCGN